MQRSIARYFALTMICVLLASLYPWAARARTSQGDHPTLSPTNSSLASVLRSDGILDLPAGFAGSLDPAGYRQASEPGKAPRFALTDDGDEYWTNGFDYPGMNGRVSALVVDAAGNLYAGGGFTMAGGVSVNYIAKWDGTTWSALGSGIDGCTNHYYCVNALAVDAAGNLYAGGYFTTVGGVNANYIAKWDGTAWSALGSGMGGYDPSVWALAVDAAGDLYAGGNFITAGGVSTNYVAKWDGNAWSALGSGISLGGGYVRALVVDAVNNLYVGGRFGGPGRNIAKWDGTAWSALSEGIGYFDEPLVYALAVDAAGNLYAGGRFQSAGGVYTYNIARWDGTVWSELGSGISNGTPVRALTVDTAGNLYAGGDFTSAGGVSTNYIARWDGIAWSALDSGISGVNATVYALAADAAGNLYAGGDFTTAGGVSTDYIAKWNGSNWSALGSGMTGYVNAVAVDAAGNLFAGGWFTAAGGVSANYIAKWDGTTWSPLSSGMNYGVLALAVDTAGNLYAGGGFTTAGGVSVNYIAKWDGNNWSALGSGMNDYVNTLTVDAAGNLYAGGYFTTAGGISANHIARWDGSSWSALGSGMNGGVSALRLDATGNLYAGGRFTTAGGKPSWHIAQWTGAVGQAGLPTDPTNSTLAAQPATVPADGVTTATVEVQLRDVAGRLLPGKTVRFFSDRGSSDSITQPAAVTNSDGRTSGTIRSRNPGTSTIQAVVMDDGVMLASSVNVTFTPYTPPVGEFLYQVDHLVNQTVSSLDRIEADAQAIAADGDYFRGEIGADAARLAADVVFGMADVVGGVNQTYRLQKAARLACPGCYVPGTWNVQFGANFPNANRLLDLGVANLEHAPASEIAEFIGWGGPQFYGKVLNAGTRRITKSTAMNATRHIFVNTSDGMSNIAWPAVHDTSDSLALLLAQQRTYLLANLPAMSPAIQSRYVDDLIGRTHALIMLDQQLSDERMTLNNLRQAHNYSPNPLLDLLLRFAAKGAATAVFDGPGAVAVGGTLLSFDAYMDGKRLNESMQMYDLATSALLGAPDTLRQTYHTAYRGLDRIGRGLPGDRARGEIVNVTHHSQGSGWGPFWNETASWSEVTLFNNGASETTYRLTSRYLADTTRFLLPWATMDLIEEATVTLQPGESATVRIDYKRANGTRGLSPRGETCLPLIGCVPVATIWIDVLGTNTAGTYGIASHNSQWQPTFVDMAGREVTGVTETLTAIDPPLTAFVQAAPWAQQYETQLWINNPFSNTAVFTVTQSLPAGITLHNTGGAVQVGNNLVWTESVNPSALDVVRFTFDFPATPGTTGSLPAAILDVVNPLNSQPLNALSNSPTFTAIWPLTFDHTSPGYVLPSSTAPVVITATNWLTDEVVAGILSMTVTDAMSATVSSQSQPINVPAAGISAATFTLPANLSAGQYIVHGTINALNATGEIFTDRLQVGLNGPSVDYEVSPMGVVRPGDTLVYTVRFTNTLDVPLSTTVVTASIPISSTVVAGSITGGGVIEPDQVRWTVGDLGINQVVQQQFAVQVDGDATPLGIMPGQIASAARLTADQIAPTISATAWNLASFCGLLPGDVNCDCHMDTTDITTVANSWLFTPVDPGYTPLYDVVPDQRIDIADVQVAAGHWLSVCQ